MAQPEAPEAEVNVEEQLHSNRGQHRSRLSEGSVMDIVDQSAQVGLLWGFAEKQASLLMCKRRKGTSRVISQISVHRPEM